MNHVIHKILKMVSFNDSVCPADPQQKDEINKKAFEKFNKEHSTAAATADKVIPSERFEGKSVNY